MKKRVKGVGMRTEGGPKVGAGVAVVILWPAFKLGVGINIKDSTG
jgi:hypothetical protein